jgi:hypothetical protein
MPVQNGDEAIVMMTLNQVRQLVRDDVFQTTLPTSFSFFECASRRARFQELPAILPEVAEQLPLEDRDTLYCDASIPPRSSSQEAQSEE